MQKALKTWLNSSTFVKYFVAYDSRAEFGDTSEAAVLTTGASLEEIRSQLSEFPRIRAYIYEITPARSEGGKIIDETETLVERFRPQQ